MRIILLGIGSILTILFILHMNRGKQYNSLVENLNDNEFPLSSLYIVGFSWSSGRFLAFSGKKATTLKTQASLLYESQFAEYYANVIWAQTITLVHLFLTVVFLLASVMYAMATFLLVVGIFMTVLVGVYCLQNMDNILAKRTEECEAELPEVVSTMAILVNSGMMLRDAWTMIGENGQGTFYEMMRKSSDYMRNGYSDADAIFLFGKSSNSTEIKKFTSALLQSLEKGGGELGVFLAQQSSELWNTKRQKMLQKGEKAATKLLMPIVLIFVGIIIIVMTAAFAGSLF